MSEQEPTTKYIHQEIEKKWQNYWSENNVFVTDLEDFSKPKKYILPMFPYPSGSGLHVGHVRNYMITDVAARFYRMNGFNVLMPTGWDAFGLPSEQYAIQTNNHPSLFNTVNIKRFKEQLNKLGFSYDWSKEINTSDPAYYRWTQWIFKQIYLEDLAEYTKKPVFWCEELGTVLSHEEVKNIDGRLFSERGSFPVVRREIPQWTLRITKYARKLSDDLDNLDWPLSIKNLQKNWIGVSKGLVIKFEMFEGEGKFINVFTTRADTIFGVNSIAISPLHPMLEELVSVNFAKEVFDFCKEWKDKDNGLSKIDQRLEGRFTGSYCLNPVTTEKISIWVTNFVFDHYGTGALMISPFSKQILDNDKDQSFLKRKEAEQNRQIDHRFSLQYNLPIREFTFLEKSGKVNYSEDTLLAFVNTREKAIEKITNYLIDKERAFPSETYHLRDWVFSRQRYWGEPIPVLHLEDGSTEVLNDSELPLKLPELSDFSPSSKYYSPLQKLPEWVNLHHDNANAKRDVNVMPQWAGSCWYYIAFLLRSNGSYLDLDSSKAKALIDHWLPIDLYVGGQEHANLHLLYSRFWHKVLRKIRILDQQEPFQKLLCQGMILSENGDKMSKSRGNVINPDYCVEEWGADSLRLYEAFLAPIEQTSSFSLTGVAAMKKWLNRVHVFFTKKNIDTTENQLTNNDLKIAFRKLVREVTEDYHKLKLNLVVAKLMEFINICYLAQSIPFSYAKGFIQLLNPLAPHITEELWSRFSNRSIVFNPWPSLPDDEEKEDTKRIIQVDGRKRGILEVSQNNMSDEDVLKLALEIPEVASFLVGKEILKIVKFKNKLINIVTNIHKR